MTEPAQLSPEEQKAYDAAEATHARVQYIASLPEETRNKAFEKMEGMNDQQQAQVWDRMRFQSNQQQNPQIQR